jgi:hypothetical protein
MKSAKHAQKSEPAHIAAHRRGGLMPVDKWAANAFLASAICELKNAAEFWPSAKSHCDGLTLSIRALQKRIKKGEKNHAK